MTCHLGFREVVIDNSSVIHWKQVTVDTGAAQSTLQDIKVPEYGGCYMYRNQSPSTQNRYIFWRVCHDIVEIWEDSLDINFQYNHVQLRFADTPVLEGLSIHETSQHVMILLATVSSIHRLKLPHPLNNPNGQHNHSIFRDLTYHTLREYHNHHVLNSNSAGEGLPHTASTYLISEGPRKGDAVFILGQNGGSLFMVSMANLPYAVYFNTIKTTSLINRLFTGFVPTMFRGMEGGETVCSLVLENFNGEVMVFGICFDGRLRAWSCTKLECILAHNVLENTAEAGKRMIPGAQRHLIRSCVSKDTIYLAIFLSFAEKQMIVLFTPCLSMGQLTLQLIKTLYPPQYDMIDLLITPSYIWSLWTDSTNETKLLYSSTNFNGNAMKTPGLGTAFLEPFPPKEIPLSDPSTDPSEIYLKELLAPNRFSAYTLQKALGIYRRNVDMSRMENNEGGYPSTGLWKMGEAVEAALRDEIEAHLTSDMSDEEVAEVKLHAWAAFYSHTLQYHQVATKALGIVGVGGGGLVAVMRKQSVSWVRPLDALELLILGPPKQACVASLASTPILSEDTSVAVAVVTIARPLRAIRSALDPEVAAAFLLDLRHSEPPDQVAASIATSLLSVSSSDESNYEEPLSRTITSQMSGATGVVSGFEAYLRALELDLGNPDALNLESTAEILSTDHQATSPWLSAAFSSRLGSCVIAAVVSQLAQHRLQLCRDLLLLQRILLQLNILSPEKKSKIHSTLLPQTSLLTQAYFALSRVGAAHAHRPTPAALETSRRQTAALGINETASFGPILLDLFPPTTMELFVLSIGGAQARMLVEASVEEEERNGASWAQVLMPLATTVAQLAWPISKCLALVEFLVWGNQHTAAQEYIRLLQPWCEWNSCSRKFLLGISLLNEGEARKAAQLFLSASEGVATEEYLGIKIAGGGPQTPLEEAQVQYCLKVIRLLDQSGHVSLALEVAKASIAMAPVDDPGLAALYSMSFKYHLELEHHDEAFTTLMACPDQHRRRNCLRQLIITLYERKCLSALVSYNYGTLESEVITILENRARSADILVTNYYDFLFSFHIRKHNFKKAAWVMYECALRLNKEGLGEKGLNQQAKCYLACINCLRHISPDQAWIIKPIARVPEETNENQDIAEEEENQDAMPKSLKLMMKHKKKPQIKVLEVSDLEREYQLVYARLKLFKVHPSSSYQQPGGPMSASDTVSLLIHGKLFRDALKLCHLFEITLEPVFEGLALACIDADASEDKSTQSHWLSENGIPRDSREGAVWWSFLGQLLDEEEKGRLSVLHKIVTSALLQRGHSIPAWLIDSYKKRNCSELLRLFLCHGLIEVASRLTVNLIDALLGLGTEQMGLNNALHVNAPPVWVPYNFIDHLILELEEVKDHPHYKMIYDELMGKIEKYQNELLRVSFDRQLLLK